MDPVFVGGEVRAGRERARPELLPETAVAGRARGQHMGRDEPPPAGDAAEEPSRDRARRARTRRTRRPGRGRRPTAPPSRSRPEASSSRQLHRALLAGLGMWRLRDHETTSLLPRAAFRSRRPIVTFPLAPVRVAWLWRARRPRFVADTLMRAPWISRPRRSLTVTTIFRRWWRWTPPFR